MKITLYLNYWFSLVHLQENILLSTYTMLQRITNKYIQIATLKFSWVGSFSQSTASIWMDPTVVVLQSINFQPSDLCIIYSRFCHRCNSTAYRKPYFSRTAHKKFVHHTLLCTLSQWYSRCFRINVIIILPIFFYKVSQF